MFKVFLSSTSRDLADYREAVHRALDGLPGFQLIKMEDFGARDAEAKDLCARLVQESDLLVGLMGHYYGSCPPNESISYTELEYRTAKDAGLPRLMFAAPDNFSCPISLRESDASFERQQALRREVMSERVVASFATPEQLASAVTKALFVWHEEQRRAEQPAAAAEAEQTAPAAVPEDERPVGPNPYRGLEAFRKEDAERFFGREALVDRLWNRFLELHAAPADGEVPTRLLAILGASGSGKSSVAQAGLLAELEKRPLPGRPAPIDVVFTPEARPLESLAVALARQATDDPAPAKKASEFEAVLRTRESHDGLRYLAERMLDVRGAGLILLVDQFEELYSLCEDEAERAAFIGNLLHAAREPRGRVSIILTLRSDFLGAVNQHPELSGLIARQNVVVPVMGEDELRRAIEEPAKRAGREIDPGTVDLLIEQTLGREGALPLLEFVLTRIWDGFGRGASAADTVREIGGVGGALANQAQAVYDSLGHEDRQIARRAFLAMVRLGEGTKDTRRRAPIAEMVTQERAEDRVLTLLRRFSEPGCRLISLSGADETTSAEVAHEALFDHWRLLQDWLDESREEIRFQRRLSDAARHWDKLGRPTGSLWRPPELNLLRDFRKRAAAEMTPLEVTFAAASERYDGRRRWAKRAGIAVPIVLLAWWLGNQWFDQWIDAQVQVSSNLVAQSTSAIENGNIITGIERALQAANALPWLRREPNKHVAAATVVGALARAVFQSHDPVIVGDASVVGDVVYMASFRPGGETLVTASRDGAWLWDVSSGVRLRPLKGHDDAVYWAEFSPDGRRVVTASDDGTARVWDAESGLELFVLKGHEKWVNTASFAPGGKQIVSASADGRAWIWDATSGRELQTLSGHRNDILQAKFSPDGSRVVTASSDREAWIWDARSGQKRATLVGHVGWVWSAEFSPDGQRVVTAGADGQMRIWDASSGRLIRAFAGHDGAVRSADFDPSGRLVVTVSDDGTARVWDVGDSIAAWDYHTMRFWKDRGSELAILPHRDKSGKPVKVFSAAFSPDGQRIVTVSADGAIRLWWCRSFENFEELRSFAREHVTETRSGPEASDSAVRAD